MKKVLLVILLLIFIISGCDLKNDEYFIVNKSDYTINVGEVINLDITVNSSEDYYLEITDLLVLKKVDNLTVEGLTPGETTILFKIKDQTEVINVTVLETLLYQVVGLDEVEVGLYSGSKFF